MELPKSKVFNNRVETLKQAQEDVTRRALIKSGGNISWAAQILGTYTTVVYRLIKKYHIEFDKEKRYVSHRNKTKTF